VLPVLEVLLEMAALLLSVVPAVVFRLALLQLQSVGWLEKNLGVPGVAAG